MVLVLKSVWNVKLIVVGMKNEQIREYTRLIYQRFRDGDGYFE